MGDPVNFYLMPPLESVLSENEIEAVIAYIKTKWTPQQQATQRERTLVIRSQKPKFSQFDAIMKLGNEKAKKLNLWRQF